MTPTIESLREEQKRLAERIEALANTKTAFEVGKWYTGHDALLIYNSNEDLCTGFYRGKWNTDWSFSDSEDKRLSTPATKEEIESALIKEAERRGFKEGVWYKNTEGSTQVCGARFEYHHERDFLSSSWGTGCIYGEGKWAEILKDEPIKIGTAYGKYEGGKFVIDGCGYTRDQIAMLSDIMFSGQVKSLNVGCSGQYKVSHEDIQKILNGFK